jgi:glycosyltransferase involved in cell wall biosynthesis
VSSASFLRVSVIIAVYNGERFLRETVDNSILTQRFSEFELMSRNDVSTGTTLQIRERPRSTHHIFIQRFSRYRLRTG